MESMPLMIVVFMVLNLLLIVTQIFFQIQSSHHIEMLSDKHDERNLPHRRITDSPVSDYRRFRVTDLQ